MAVAAPSAAAAAAAWSAARTFADRRDRVSTAFNGEGRAARDPAAAALMSRVPTAVVVAAAVAAVLAAAAAPAAPPAAPAAAALRSAAATGAATGVAASSPCDVVKLLGKEGDGKDESVPPGLLAPLPPSGCGCPAPPAEAVGSCGCCVMEVSRAAAAGLAPAVVCVWFRCGGMLATLPLRQLSTLPRAATSAASTALLPEVLAAAPAVPPAAAAARAAASASSRELGSVASSWARCLRWRRRLLASAECAHQMKELSTPLPLTCRDEVDAWEGGRGK